MNQIYSLVWSQVNQAWVAVAENASGHGKSSAARKLAVAAVLMSGSLLVSSVYAADATNAIVVGGAGSVSQNGTTTTINQASQRLAIDWTSLSTRANEALVFSQPNAQAIALNRITGSSPSELLGSLTANGQVFILNPNGVLFGAGSQVNVGGLAASTLSMNNADFMAGGSTFTKDPTTSGSVVNQGAITATDGGYAALIGGTVRNEGTIHTPLGTALLAAGNKVTLNLNNGSLIGYSIDQGALHALAENKQLIRADGGQVLMSAKALDQLSIAVINNTGVIEARTVQNKNGRIMLMGDMNVGTVNVGGTLDASAPGGGDGGFIETSAAHVKVADTARITTRSAAGKTGQWLIDPFDFVVASSGGDMTGATLSSQLDNNNVTLTTTAGSTGTNGDLSINDAVAWSAANTLTLVGERDVNVNANLTYSGAGTAGVTVQAVRDINVGANAAIASSGTGTLNVTLGGPTAGTAAGGAINMGSASSIATNGGDVSFKAAAIKLAGASVAAAGGNIAMTAAGSSASHSLEITDVSGTRSNVSTTGAGTITLNGSLTSGGASATGGSAGGVVVTNSSITSDTGAIAITGHAGDASTGSQIERGFRLDAGTQITSAGNISLTGTVSGNQPIAPVPYFGPSSMGGELASGTSVSSTGGNVTLSGTIANRFHYNGTGLALNGKVESGAGSKITLSGAAIISAYVSPTGVLWGGRGTGLSLGLTSEVVAGTGGLDITGTVNSSSISTDIYGARLAGAASSTGNIAVTGTSTGGSAVGVRALDLVGGTLMGLGTATITLRGSGVPSPAPAGNYDVNVAGTAVSTAGGEISVIGNRVNIQSAIDSGSGRTTITPWSSNSNRSIILNGAPGSELWALNLTNSELDLITASVLQLGGGAYDISIGGSGATTTMTSTPALSLLTTGSITQTAGLTVNSLKAVGSSVTLTHANNQISNISGVASSGSFQAASTAALTVGTVDGVSGINAAGKVLVQTIGADLTLASAVTAASTADDALVLVAGGNFINNVGAAALQIAGAARWQVWSTNPANDSRNNLDYDFKQYNASYGTTAVAQATGNGVFYTLAPTITSALTGTVSKTYDTATAATLTAANFSAAAGAVDGDTVVLNTSTTGTYDNKNAGTGKTVTATGVSIASTTNGTKNVYGYTFGGASGNVGTITQASLAVSGISAVDKVYDAGTSAALTGTAAISVLGSDVVTVGGTGVGTFTDKNVGTNKTVAVSGYTLSGADAGNYALAQPAGVTATITQASLAVSGISAVDKAYDANTSAALTGTAAVSALGGDVVTVAGTGIGAFTDKNVGTAKAVAVSGYTLSGADAGNYAVVLPTGLTADITAKTLSYSTIAANKTYDGTNVATFSGTGLNGVVSGDTVVLSQSGSFSDKNAATGKTVSYVSSLSGGDAGNYVLASNSGTTTADITPALLTVAANSADKFYDGIAYANNNGVTISGLINGESVADLSGSLGYGGSSQDAIGIGNYAITPGGLSSPNYQIHFVDGVLTIKALSQASAALGGPALEPAYDSVRQTVAGNIGSASQTNRPAMQQALNQSETDGNAPQESSSETSALAAHGNTSGAPTIERFTPRLSLAGCSMTMPDDASGGCQ